MSAQSFTRIIGLDPGAVVGIAEVDASNGQLLACGSADMMKAQATVLAVHQHAGDSLLVVMEDARLRRSFGKMDALVRKYGPGVREGAGAAKRDATLWAQFMDAHRIRYVCLMPRGTKRSAGIFQAITGWKARTNEHARDAGLIVYGMRAPQAAMLWQQELERRAAPPKPRRARRAVQVYIP